MLAQESTAARCCQCQRRTRSNTHLAIALALVAALAAPTVAREYGDGYYVECNGDQLVGLDFDAWSGVDMSGAVEHAILLFLSDYVYSAPTFWDTFENLDNPFRTARYGVGDEIHVDLVSNEPVDWNNATRLVLMEKLPWIMKCMAAVDTNAGARSWGSVFCTVLYRCVRRTCAE